MMYSSSRKDDGVKERKTSLDEGNVSPYFKVLRKPSAKDLGLSETHSRSRSQTRSNSDSSDDIPPHHQNGSRNGEPDPSPDIHLTKPSPPQKPPRLTRRIESLPDLPRPQISERTQSYVSKIKPESSQRHKPRLMTIHTAPTIAASNKPTTTSQNTVISPTAVNGNNPYPWRTSGNGLGGVGMGLGGTGMGLGMDFELSMEPRNFSRQPLPAKDNATSQINGATPPRDDSPRHKSPSHGACLPSKFDCPDGPMRLQHGECTTDYSSNPSNQTVNRSFIMSGEYDRLESSNPVQRNNISGDFDHLIPSDGPIAIMTHAASTSTADSSTESDDDRVGVVLPTPPLESSQSQPSTPPLTSSPLPTRKHTRRKSEDLSELSVAKERQLCASPQAYSPSRRQSAYNSPHIPKRFMLPEGIEESSNWQFLPHGYMNKMNSPNNKNRRKRSKWNLFASDGKQKNVLFNPKKPSQIQRYVSHQEVDLNCVNLNGDTPLHCYVKMEKPEKFDIIIAFLVHCKIHSLEIDKKDNQGNTPLHLATMLNDMWIIKVLLSFGANINEHNHAHQTPQDFLSSRDSPEEAHELFMKLYARPGGGPVSLKPSFLNESLNSIINERYEIEEAEKLGMYLSEERLTAFVFKLEQLLKKEDMIFSLRNHVERDEGGRHFSGTFFDPLIARERQDYIIQDWKKTLEFKKGVGSRVLFLDGGGIRGLIQIEVLALIQKITGREVTDLFDWIVGTSTGGIIAMAMVYANMTLPELRQLYFQLREDVFSGGIMSAAKRTEALEHILKGLFKDIKMCDRLPSSKCPRVLISAVSTKTNPPQLHFFNNCFNNQYSKEFVWKVARYTSAGPTYFMECNNYVDGGVLANNPCMEAWLEISKFYESQGTRPNFAMAVSIGTGIYPPEQLGEVDFFSKGLLDLRGTWSKAKKLIKMLSTALVESERVAEIFSRTCDALDTHFFRFSPALSHSISPDETDIKVLIDMVIQTQAYLHEQTCKAKFDQMIRLFKHIATISRGLNLNSKP